MTISVLQKTPTLSIEPYPHIVIENALPEDVYNQLEKEWPTQQLLSTEPFDNGICYRPVSYTHLTLPTILRV